MSREQQNSTNKFQEELKKLPHKPGVYIMRDEKDRILYVGKAVNLYNRVRSYFREKIGRGPKIERMVSLIHHFEYIITDTELEALVLENNLIKEHRPKYNTMLMDDKTYPYIKVTMYESYPRILFSREMKKDKAKYFGPYTSAAAVKDTIDLINKLYMLRTCNRAMPTAPEILPDSNGTAALQPESETGSFTAPQTDTEENTYAASKQARNRACLNHHIGQCLAPCQGTVTKEEYQQQLDKALEFLNGNYGPIQKELKEKMEKASEQMEFEEAIRYRDLLESVVAVSQKQKIEDHAQKDKDIIALAQDISTQELLPQQGKSSQQEPSSRQEAEEAFRESEQEMENISPQSIATVVQVFFVRNGRMTGREHFYMSNTEGEAPATILSSFVKQFYAGTPFIPSEIMLSEEIEDREMIESWLSAKKNGRVHLRNPKIGQKEKLVELAAKNAALILAKDKESIQREEARTIGAVRELEGILHLANIYRMEAFDISNISGFQNVGSMVVYEKGKPKRSDYRKFKIKTVAGPDDYACMREVLTRRFLHSKEADAEKSRFDRLPDLLLMDGGRGQVNIALEVLEELQLQIPVCGMVKDDHHRTRGLYFNNVELPIDTHGEAFKLITRVQDEAHRFAIEYHRSLRKKDQVHSVLDEIPGVGPKRRQALMKAFASIEEIKGATLEELIERGNLPKNAAEEIYKFFRQEQTPTSTGEG